MIVVAGEALVDLVVDQNAAVVARLGGGPYNVARTIGRLGLEVNFLGMISNDRFGREFRRQLADDAVGFDDSLLTDAPTTLAVAELDDDGSASYRFYFAGTSAPALSAVPPGWAAPQAVHAGTLGLVLEPMASTVLEYLGRLDAATLVMLDPNCRPRVVADRAGYVARIEQTYAHADVVKVSIDDVEYLAPDTGPRAYARDILERGPKAVLLTGGGASTWAITAEGERELRPEPVEVADTIGAGDSFGGAFLAWWLDTGYGPAALGDLALVSEATSAAQEVAGFTCRQVGAQPPRRSQLSARWQR